MSLLQCFFPLSPFQSLPHVFVSVSFLPPPTTPLLHSFHLFLLLTTILHLVPSVFSCFSRVFLLIPDFPLGSPGCVRVYVCKSQVSALWAVSVNGVSVWGGEWGAGGWGWECSEAEEECESVCESRSCWVTLTRSVWEKFPAFPRIGLG